jgi:hypothetical protein
VTIALPTLGFTIRDRNDGQTQMTVREGSHQAARYVEKQRSVAIVAMLLGLLVALKHASLREPYHWDALGYVAGTALDMVDNGFRLVREYKRPPSASRARS